MTVLELSAYFIWRGREEGIEVTPMKLQKLMYFAHGWCLGIYSRSLVKDEFAEAWKYGPVFPSIFHRYKEYGLSNLSNIGDVWKYAETVMDFIEMEDWESELLNAVWNRYKKYNGLELSEMTHAEGNPWTITMNRYKQSNADIPNRLIEDFFKKKINERGATAERAG